MRKLFFTLASAALSLGYAQNGHDIKITLKNSKDKECYLAKYQFDKQYIVDTAKVGKGGVLNFKGKEPLEKGVYFIANEAKVRYFDFLVNDAQKFSINTDTVDFVGKMTIEGSKENQDFLNYIKFMTEKNTEFTKFRESLKGKDKKDSTKLSQEKVKSISEGVKQYQKDYLVKQPKSFLSDLINLQNEIEVPEAPILANGRKDSLWQYYYYKDHYWDKIDLSDDKILRTPMFYHNKLKNFFEKVVVQHPDSISKAADKLIARTKDNKEMFKYMVFYLTSNYETSKVMGMDAVFVNLVKNYYKTNKAFWVDKETNDKIVKRGEILEPLLLGKVAPELYCIDTIGLKYISKIGMDTINDSERLTKKYYDNLSEIQKLYKSLLLQKNDYTVVVFWDPDCGHCQKEVPVLHDAYLKMKKEGIDIGVFAVDTQHEYAKWKKFIKEKNLTWVNVCDATHINNLKEKYDIYSTPVIYILDKNKVIKAKRVGAEQVEDIIKMLMKEKKK